MLTTVYVSCTERANNVNLLRREVCFRGRSFAVLLFRTAPPRRTMAPENAVATPPRREAGSQFQSQGDDVQTQNLSFAEYDSDGFFDEMFDGKGWPRNDCLTLCQRIRSMP